MEKVAPLEFELHEYVDGVLDEQGMDRVEAYLEKNPEVAAQVRDYLRQKTNIRAFADQGLSGREDNKFASLERQLARRLKRRSFLGMHSYAAMALLVLAGWLGHALYTEFAFGPSYAEEIVQAHFLSSSDPTEVQGLTPERIARLFARIGEMERVPNLRSLGYEPIGAQLLPSDAGTMLHIPYRSDQGTYISYFLLHDDDVQDIPRHILHRSGLTLAYWQNEHSHHAIAASLPDPDIESIAAFLQSDATIF